jgi:hypothetical protein
MTLIACPVRIEIRAARANRCQNAHVAGCSLRHFLT